MFAYIFDLLLQYWLAPKRPVQKYVPLQYTKGDLIDLIFAIASMTCSLYPRR